MPKPNPLVQQFKRKIFQNTKIKNKKATLNSLKRNYSMSEIREILPHIILHPLTNKFVYGQSLPKSFDELRKTFYTLSTDFDKESEWYLLSLFKYASDINIFLSLKSQFEKQLLKGNYDLASGILSEINSNVCYSLWALENHFLVEELKGGLEKNKEFLSKINSGNLEILTSLLADFYSNKVEKKLSIFRFNTILEDFISGLSKGFQEYWSIKLNYHNTETFGEFLEILTFESKSSVIDKYLTLLRICQQVTLYGSESDKIVIKKRVEKLSAKINDPILQNLLLLERPTHHATKSDMALIKVVDHYTTGNYQEALKTCFETILEYPQEFSLYEIYIRCLFHLKQPLTPLSDKKCIMNEIVEDLYNIYEKNENTGASISRLMKSVNILDSFPIAGQIYSFLQTLLPNKETSNVISYSAINNTLKNPLFYHAYNDYSKSLSYLNSLHEAFPDSITINFHQNFVQQIIDGAINSKNGYNVPKERSQFYKAKLLSILLKHEEAITILESLLNTTDNQIIKEDVVVNLFDSYRETKQFDKCIRLYISSYLSNHNNILRFKLSTIFKHIEKAKFKNVTPTIDLPLFFYLTKQDNHSTNVALRVFLKQFNITRPSELVAQAEAFSTQLLIELLLNVCTPEILKYSATYKSTKDILNERLDIYQVLILIDPDDIKLYKQEIRKISQSLAIIEGVRQVDESKIYVDEKGLIVNEFSEIENNFDRYIEISNLIKERPYFFVDLKTNKKYLYTFLNLEQEDEEETEKARLSTDVKFGLFKELFYEILNRFLFSNKYGLDSYLSTRIRHGTLLGQLRSEFQKQNLITQKDKLTEQYFKNEYWDNEIDLDWETKEQIQQLLADFSRKIDFIANNLKEKYIQIKIPIKNTEGLFDYDFSSKSLWYYYERLFNKITDYDTFVKGVFSLIWHKTRTNLEIIQNMISTTVKDEIISNLIQLEKDLKASVEDVGAIQELINNITNCRTHIISEVDKIADWFKLRESITSDFKIDKVIDTSIEITKKTSQINNINVHYDINSESLLKGEFFIHFFDLLRIFLENAVSYSKLQPTDLQFSINVTELNNILRIEILNNLAEDFDIENLKTIFLNRKNDLNKGEWNMEVLKTEIGGTGFFKAKKILESDLLNETNKFDFFVDEKNNVNVIIEIDLIKLKT